MTTQTAQTKTRDQATEGTQAHSDLANIKLNIKVLMVVHEMTREEAKTRVNSYNFKLLSNEECNRQIAAEVKRQARLKEREAQQEAARQREAAAEAKAKKDNEDIIRRAAEEKERAAKAADDFVGPRQETVKPKTESKLKRQGGMTVSVDGVWLKTLVAAMVSTGLYDDHETKLRSFHWNKIRKVIQKGQECVYEGHSYKMDI